MSIYEMEMSGDNGNGNTVDYSLSYSMDSVIESETNGYYDDDAGDIDIDSFHDEIDIILQETGIPRREAIEAIRVCLDNL